MGEPADAPRRPRWEPPTAAVVPGLVALAAIAIAWVFAANALAHSRPMGLPLDDSYIYLTYAKQLGRGQPFTYFPGSGYSAGATSILWPMLLAPFWTLGARGHALVWVAFGLCAVLSAVTAIGVARLVEPIAGRIAGVLAGLVLLAIAPFTASALSGMEVALASALLVTMIRGLIAAPRSGPPPRGLALLLAALSLARPEAIALVAAITGITAIGRLRQRAVAAAAWWLVPLAAPAAWLCANRVLAGHWLPNTGIAKSHFYLPGFDWTYWRAAVWQLTGDLLHDLFRDPTSPLVWPRLFALLWLAGAFRVVAWAHRARRLLGGVVIVVAPLGWMLLVIASSGQWSFQGYRYIAPAFPLLVVAAGCVLGAPPTRRPIWGRLHAALAIVGVAGFLRAAYPAFVIGIRLYAQGVMDTNTQVVAIGEYVHRKLPDARILLHDAGAIAYYGDGEIYDMLGLVTNHQAGVAAHGPGARFEFLERIPPAERFTHFAYYPGWLGTTELFGPDLFHTVLHPGFAPSRLAGEADMQIIAASWDHVGTGERPLDDHTGWAVVDRVDVADLASEADHAWIGTLGRRNVGDPTAKWSILGREVGARGLVLDGGRTIRGGLEQFTITADPGKPIRLILRTGGARAYPYHELINRPVAIQIFDDAGHELAHQTLPAPTRDEAFIEVVFELAAGAPATLHTVAAGPYRAFHWFVLQPE